jgi:hypothetical protein
MRLKLTILGTGTALCCSGFFVTVDVDAGSKSDWQVLQSRQFVMVSGISISCFTPPLVNGGGRSNYHIGVQSGQIVWNARVFACSRILLESGTFILITT